MHINTEIYHFNIGAFKCLAVNDGTLTYAPPSFPPPATFLFCNAPAEVLGKALDEYHLDLRQWTGWTSSYTCLFINTGKYKVLVDTGADGLSPDTGKLLPNLQKAGISPADIDLVILTHAHPDHIGGNINHEGRPIFNRARWVIGKREWEFWTSEQAEKQLPEHGRDVLIGIARKNLLPLGKQIELMDREGEIIPGIRAISAPGHTPGQMALEISSHGKHLMYISDIVLHPLHLAQPAWCAAVDLLPDQTTLTRGKILPELAAEKTLVMAFHFPFPGLGYVVSRAEGWQWEPLILQS